MFGFLIGTLSLIGLIKLSRFGRYGHGAGGPRRWMLRRLYQRLDTTPGQEKVIAEVLDDVERKGQAVREQFVTSRGGFARAMRGEHFDNAAVGEAFDAQQASLEELKKATREGMSRVHEALNPDQRKVLGDLLEHGPGALHGCGGHGHFGHHRGHHHGGWSQASGPASVNL
jgi:Spy/CpxP family protein refolding chaperone